MNPRSKPWLGAIFNQWTHRLPELAQCMEKAGLLAIACAVAATNESAVLSRKHKAEISPPERRKFRIQVVGA
jgi:hypothetical protein